MQNLDAVILGVIQGLAEFLPISSSGHLVLFQKLLGFNEPELLLDLVLHFGTLSAVCIYFSPDLKEMFGETWIFLTDLCKGQASLNDMRSRPSVDMVLMVLAGTLPTAVIGLAFRSSLENMFASTTIVGVALIMTGFILLATLFLSKNEEKKNRVMLFSALCIGVVQGIALVPGISRSGITIVCGMLCGLKWDLAARFSFLLAIPAILGAVVLQLHSETLAVLEYRPLLVGFVSSALIGLLALKVLMGLVKKGRLFLFAPYCWAVGLLAIIW
jgi:undecaprenyl-diphosphatase